MALEFRRRSRVRPGGPDIAGGRRRTGHHPDIVDRDSGEAEADLTATGQLDVDLGKQLRIEQPCFTRCERSTP